VLTKFYVENFQSLMYPQSVRLAPLTLIVGANSSGKSSLSRAIRLLQQSFEQREVHFSGNRVDLTSFRTAISQHKASEEIAIGLTASAILKWKSSNQELRIRNPEIRLRMREKSSAPISGFSGGGDFEIHHLNGDESSLIGAGQLHFQAKASSGSSKRLDLTFSVPSGADVLNSFLNDLPSRDGDIGFSLSDNAVAPSELAGLLKLEGDAARDPSSWKDIPILMAGLRPIVAIDSASTVGPYTEGMRVASQLEKLVERFFAAIASTLTGLQHIAPLRTIASGYAQKPVGKHFINPSGDNIQQVLLAMDERGFRGVSDRLEKLTRGKYKLAKATLRSDQPNLGDFSQILLVDLSNGEPLPVAFPDAGVGISQVLPIIVAISRTPFSQRRFGIDATPSRPITFIEQPELHLHPEMQADLADLLVETTKPVKRDNGRLVTPSQIVIETHSESMILRIQKRIREGKINRDQVAIIGVDDFAGGGSLAQECRLSSEGMFVDDLPRDFSTLRLNDLL
jgi:hypothetical protein